MTQKSKIRRVGKVVANSVEAMTYQDLKAFAQDTYEKLSVLQDYCEEVFIRSEVQRERDIAYQISLIAANKPANVKERYIYSTFTPSFFLKEMDGTYKIRLCEAIVSNMAQWSPSWTSSLIVGIATECPEHAMYFKDYINDPISL